MAPSSLGRVYAPGGAEQGGAGQLAVELCWHRDHQDVHGDLLPRHAPCGDGDRGQPITPWPPGAMARSCHAFHGGADVRGWVSPRPRARRRSRSHALARPRRSGRPPCRPQPRPTIVRCVWNFPAGTGWHSAYARGAAARGPHLEAGVGGAVQKVEAVADPPEPDHAHSQHARRGGGHVSRLQPSSWTSSATRYRPPAGARDSPSGLGSGRKCLVVFNYSISITN